MFKHILLAYDGSDYSCRAAEVAAGLARLQPDAVLRVICVVDPPGNIGEPYQSEIIAKQTILGEEVLQRAEDIIGPGINVRRELIFGAPAESIISVADNHNCDLIVMGTRGFSPLRGLLLGSQTQKVMSLSKSSVLVVK